ncbi:Protein kinase DC2 [Eumeta japonica]|uniref:Protein kinase DC2 n=1 Tax=Eumeta variegata TaxID=151549 RepID=A0A4C1VRF1_EUMVA|nr:Protein kinase DC2 [Eumeta japonica]
MDIKCILNFDIVLRTHRWRPVGVLPYYQKCGSEDVKRHRWFKHVDWADVFLKKLTPPIVPTVSYEGDTSNFDDYPETDWKAARALDPDELKLFANF